MANKEIITKLGGYRDSSIELLRIATMLVIVAHHYVVNSGIISEITLENVLQFNSLNNINAFRSYYLLLHAFGSVIVIYVICTLIDMVRINFFEKTFFKWYDKKYKEIL